MIVYSQDQHQLSLDEIDKDALFVMNRLREAGFTAYLVGGGVRDLLLKRKPKDFDISTSAEPEEIRKLFRNCILIGRRFRLAHIRFGRKILEVSTFRAGNNESDELIVRDNVWGNPEQDATRRDFSINGLFYDPATETIIDYVGGYEDAQNKYIRTIGQPYLRFKQDPVRMLRLLKFVARFGLDIDPDSRIALLECRQDIVKSSQARILEEVLRMLESGSSAPFFKLLAEYSMLPLLMPGLSDFLETSDGNDVYGYLQEVDSNMHEPHHPILERPVLLACLVYPLFQKHIQTRYVDRGHYPHLGQVQDEAYSVIDEVFHPFFSLPRRLKLALMSILAAQYRFTPVEKVHKRRIRIPNDPDFKLALDFFEMRASLEPGLREIYFDWADAFDAPSPPAPKKKRRRIPRSGER